MTDAVREILHTRKKFISLLIMNFLAVGFLAGLRMTAPDMKHSLDVYYDGPILMDLRMPIMDGFEATRRIRRMEDPKKASIPIVALSANVYEKDRSEAAAAGIDDFEDKPIFLDKLLATMNKYL